MRIACALALAITTALLAACGSDPASKAPGSPENPLVATPAQEGTSGAGTGRSNESAASARAKGSDRSGSGAPAGGSKSSSPGGSDSSQAPADPKPGYKKLVEQQSSKPEGRFTPCNLVSQAQAAAIVGGTIKPLVEAPQGPTCIYRSATGKQFITVSVQSADFARIKRQLHRRSEFSLNDATAYCGTYGQPMLYVPLSGGRVLSVAAPCGVAKQFAAKAIPRLSS
jgi:hypothetical protein